MIRIISRSPKLARLLEEISELDFRNEASKLSMLVNHMHENAESTNISLNRVIICTMNYYGRSMEATNGILMLLDRGLLSSAFCLNRMVFELWAAAYFVEKSVRDFRTHRDEEKLGKIANRLFTGARFPVNLPWGGESTEKPIHINDMLAELEGIYPEATNTYSFLCEFTHPNFLYSNYTLTASILPSQWDNPLFEKFIIDILEKQISLLQRSLSGLKICINTISDTCLEEYGIDFS